MLLCFSFVSYIFAVVVVMFSVLKVHAIPIMFASVTFYFSAFIAIQFVMLTMFVNEVGY